MALNNPNLYGKHPQHSSIRGIFKDYETDFVKSWKCTIGEVKPKLIRGRSAGKPIGRTGGVQEDSEFSCTLYYAGWNDLRDYLKTQAPSGKMTDAIIDIVLLVDAADGTKKIEVFAAQLVGYPLNSDEGEEPIEVELKWVPAEIIENGCPLI